MAGKHAIKFGTDGWRSLVGEDFTFPNVRAVTQATAEYLNKHLEKGRKKAVLVGYDARPLGDRFAEVVAEVFAGNGFKVLLTTTPMPTPAVSFAIREFDLQGGVVVTASHNPFTYNGFKFKPYYAGPAEPDMTKWIEGRLFKSKVKELPLADGLKSKKIEMVDLEKSYFAFLKKYAKWSVIKSANIKVGYDSMYGAGQDLLERVVTGTKVKVQPLRTQSRTQTSNFRPEPIGEHLGELGKFVKKNKQHIGIANDGDADRAGLVTPDGKFVSAQETMALLAWHLLENRKLKGTMVSTISATNMLDDMAEHYGVTLKRTPVGFKHLARVMRSEDVLFAGEESGGFGFKGCVPERDGILAALLVFEMLAMTKKSLNDILIHLRKQFGAWAYSRSDLHLSKKLTNNDLLKWAKKTNPQSLKLGQGIQVDRFETKDGVKVVMKDRSWLLLRPSGTEPLLRVYAEAKTQAKLKAILAGGQKIGKAILKAS